MHGTMQRDFTKRSSYSHQDLQNWASEKWVGFPTPLWDILMFDAVTSISSARIKGNGRFKGSIETVRTLRRADQPILPTDHLPILAQMAGFFGGWMHAAGKVNLDYADRMEFRACPVIRGPARIGYVLQVRGAWASGATVHATGHPILRGLAVSSPIKFMLTIG